MSTWRPEEHVPKQIKEYLASGKLNSVNYVQVFLNLVRLLKTQKRTGWIDHSIPHAESIADHMYRMGVTCMLIQDPKIDVNKCVRIALVHDIAESLVGDITPNDPVTKEEKHERELASIKYLTSIVENYNEQAAQRMMEDWLAYEEISSPEARYVKDIDKYEMLVQCFEYERENNVRLDQFYRAVAAVKTEEVSSWVQDIVSQRNEWLKTL